MPVPVVGGDDVLQLPDAAHLRARSAVPLDDLVGDHRAGVGVRAVAVDDQRPVADVAHGRAEPQPVLRLLGRSGADHVEPARRLLVEVGKPRADRRRRHPPRPRRAPPPPRAATAASSAGTRRSNTAVHATRPRAHVGGVAGALGPAPAPQSPRVEPGAACGRAVASAARSRDGPPLLRIRLERENEAMFKRVIVGSVVAAGLVAAAPAGAATLADRAGRPAETCRRRCPRWSRPG